ncbi:uncharacterized protein LOC128551251 [Mercenaria mercenaria]|uniref:uncharacterized protein LOC128551251 n=1 Tax=Mercenaria mercenaria TaxID=6596 RepID=UPI00234F79CB|nr:uncharacterized protein LOC128551251 [Mercenaria mercenaria]
MWKEQAVQSLIVVWKEQDIQSLIVMWKEQAIQALIVMWKEQAVQSLIVVWKEQAIQSLNVVWKEQAYSLSLLCGKNKLYSLSLLCGKNKLSFCHLFSTVAIYIDVGGSTQVPASDDIIHEGAARVFPLQQKLESLRMTYRCIGVKFNSTIRKAKEKYCSFRYRGYYMSAFPY